MKISANSSCFQDLLRKAVLMQHRANQKEKMGHSESDLFGSLLGITLINLP